MNDRQPTIAGRHKLINPNDPTDFEYVIIEAADEPTEQGTPLNKANLLSDTTAEVIGDEYGDTPDTPNEALALIGAGKIGTIIRSVATDIGENYALCNGDYFNPEEYPTLAATLPKNIGAKPNPNWYQMEGADADGYDNNVSGLYNGEFVTETGIQQGAQVIAKDGSPKGMFKIANMAGTDSSSRFWYAENNGTKYICFVKMSSVKLNIYTTTDFENYTLEKEITFTNSNDYRPSYQSYSGKYDGTYYYYFREGHVNSTSGRLVAVINNNFNLVREIFVPSTYFTIIPCGDRVYGILNDNGTIGVKQLNGDVPTSISGYRTTSWEQGITNLRMSEFNDDYDVLYSKGYAKIAFIPRDGTSALKYYDATTQITRAYLDGTNDNLLVFRSSGQMYCAVTDDPTQAASWHEFTASLDFADWDNIYYGPYFRRKEVCMPSLKKVVRASLLPTITESECYNYIKIK